MSQPQGQPRFCPTRTDDRPVLFAHRLSVKQCQDRQRGQYHKCFTCVHNNAWVATKGKTPRAAEAAPADSSPKRPKVPKKGELVAVAAALRADD